MEHETRKLREMTYQDGWRKGKIALPPKDNVQSPAEHKADARPETSLERINRTVLWREAHGLGEGRWLIACLWAMPAVLFALFVAAVALLGRLM